MLNKLSAIEQYYFYGIVKERPTINAQTELLNDNILSVRFVADVYGDFKNITAIMATITNTPLSVQRDRIIVNADDRKTIERIVDKFIHFVKDFEQQNQSKMIYW